MDTRHKQLFKATCKTSRVAAAAEVGEPVMDRHIRTHHRRLLRVTAAEVEDSPIFLACRVNFLTPLVVVLDSEKEKDLEMRLHNPARTHRLTHPPCHHTATDRIGVFYQSPVWTNLQSTPRHTHHPTRRATPSHPEGVTNLLTTRPHVNMGLAVELGDTVIALAVVSGMEGLRSRNHKPKLTKWVRIRGLLNAKTLKLQNSPTPSKGTDSESVR